MTNDQHEKDLMACVHCGICLPACPTYLETGSEADSPRGRIALMRALHEGRLSGDEPDVARHLELCLGCRACESVCPSAVPYGRMLETVRENLHRSPTQPSLKATARQALLTTLTQPSRTRAALRASRWLTGGNVPRPVLRAVSSDADAPAYAPPPPNGDPNALLPELTPAVGPRRFRVGMLSGCVMRALFAAVNQDTARVLAANGCEVLANRRQRCCGALHAHNGYGKTARQMARDLIDAFSPFDGLDAIVVNSAGCGSMMKEYGGILSDDPAYADKARLFAAKVRDVSEFLAEAGWNAPLKPISDFQLPNSATVAYHDACHLAHGQGVRDAPRELLALLPGVSLVPLAESEICCGSAGVYNLTEPLMARRLLARKIGHIHDTGAQTVATGNPGCLAWIETGLKEMGDTKVRVVHPVTLLAEALA
jgi:glycolate oxidase iron-sulfur subunit